MADDADISGMPDPGTIGLASPDPTSDMPDPHALFQQHHGYPAQSDEDVAEFMRNPEATPDVRKAKSGRYGASELTGLPRAAASVALAVPAAAASVTGQLSGALGAALDPDNASSYLEQGRARGRKWAENAYNLANYVPATKPGAELAGGVLNIPGEAGSAFNQGVVKPVLGENAAQTIGDVAQDVTTDLPILGAPGFVRGAIKSAKTGYRAVKGALADAAPAEGTTYDAAGNAQAPSSAMTPPVGKPVTGDTLRAQPNPIPPPEGTQAHAKATPTPPPPAVDRRRAIMPDGSTVRTLEHEGVTARRAAMSDEERAAYDRANRIQTTGEPPEQLQARLSAEADARGKIPGSREQAPPPPVEAGGLSLTLTKPDGSVVQGTASRGPTAAAGDAALNRGADASAVTAISKAVRAGEITAEEGNARLAKLGASTSSLGDAQRGSVRLFNSPAEEGPKETPASDQQSERAGHLDAIDRLSGGQLPTRRSSALSGDYNATGDDWQMKEVGNERMRTQVASENTALHSAADNVHDSIGSEFENSVDSTTLGNRGRVTRGAIQGIEGWFDKATDGIYDTARAQNQGRPIEALKRVKSYLADDSNFTNDAEIGLQRAAKTRLERLWTTGDPDKGVPPGSVNAAERFREFLNEKGKNPNAWGVAKDMIGHTDMDVAEHGGPGLFEAARNLRKHSYQLLEEPTGIKKLLTPGDSQGINHAIPEHKVMDYIADLPREQHEHVLNVLRAGAHLGDGELAEQSAGALREIQAHVVSRMHNAARNADGSWNARKFYGAADRYARNAPDTFKDRPDVLNNLKTINDAGNTLHMDKHYPGAAAQTERTGAIGHALETGGKVAASLAHDVPFVGRMVGRAIEGGVEGLGGRISETARDKAVAKRIVDRTGKQRGSVGVLPPEEEETSRFTVKYNPDSRKYSVIDSHTGVADKNTFDRRARAQSIVDNRNKQRGAVGDLSQRDAILHDTDKNDQNHHRYSVPGDIGSAKSGGELHVVENHGLGTRQVVSSEVNPKDRGQGWGTRMLQRAVDDAHAKGQSLRSDSQVSESQVGAYKNLAKLGYDVKLKPHDKIQGTYQSHGDHVFEVRPPKASGAMLNIGLHQGNEGQPGFRKMSKQEGQGAIESTGAKVTKSSVLTPAAHGVAEPTLVASTNRPLSEPEMQKVLAKTKQSAIPQRTDAGEESMHIAPGHEEVAKNEGWDKFNPDYFRDHDGTSLGQKNPKQGGWVGERTLKNLRNKIGDVGDRVSDAMNSFDDRAASAGDALKRTPFIGGAIRKAGDVNEATHQLVDISFRAVDDRIDAAHDFLRHLPKRIANKMGDISEDLGERTNSSLNELDDKIDSAHDYLRHLPKRIANKMGNVSEDLGERTNSAMTGIDDRIDQASDALRGKQRGSVRVMNEKPLAGAPEGDRPNGAARAAARSYAKSAGIDYKPLDEYRYVDPKVAKNVGDAYEDMKHDPTNPKVAKSYAAFKAETLAQYKQMVKSGMKVDLDSNYPYKNPREMHTDVRANNHMSIYPTEVGFGASDAAPSDHPMLEKAPIKMVGKDATYNDLFRAVHDYYGHAAEGNGFRANGEYNAWRSHRQMYSDDARGAMDAETLGQNSWVNSGPPAAMNKGASSADTIYADQKAGLLPKAVVKSAEEGVGADEHHITNQLTDQERSQLRIDSTKRLVDAFKGAPATKEYAAAALAGAAKRGWYKQSSQAIVNQFGHEAPRFAALLSAMSPQVSVQTNFANALKTYINWDKAGRPEDPSVIRGIMEDSSQKSAKAAPGSSNVLDAWVNNGVRALTADDPSNVKLSGPKVHSFYNNLTDNVNEVTNDAWMASFAKMDPRQLGGKLNASGPGKSASYLALSGKVRAAASMISRLTGETWTPAEVQETVWSWAKTAYEHAEEKGDRSIPDLVKNGDITDDLIRSTPDFHQLFSSREHRGLLQSSRFAGNDERVASGTGQGADAARSSEARQAAEAALRPHLISAAERLEKVRQERRAAGRSAPKDEE